MAQNLIEPSLCVAKITMNILEETLMVRSIVPLDMANKERGKKGTENKKEPKMWVLEPDDELRQLMKAALAATGEDRSAIMAECIREELPAVVARILKERKEAAERWESVAASKKPKQNTGK